jgi:hypothetical protein
MNMNNKTRKSFKNAVSSFFSRLEHTGTRIKEVETTPKSFGRWEEPSSENDDFFFKYAICYILLTVTYLLSHFSDGILEV